MHGQRKSAEPHVADPRAETQSAAPSLIYHRKPLGDAKSSLGGVGHWTQHPLTKKGDVLTECYNTLDVEVSFVHFTAFE